MRTDAKKHAGPRAHKQNDRRIDQACFNDASWFSDALLKRNPSGRESPPVSNRTQLDRAGLTDTYWRALIRVSNRCQDYSV